jgi:hypothetical protein
MDRPFPWLGSKISGNGISLPAVFHLEPICGNSNSSLEYFAPIWNFRPANVGAENYSLGSTSGTRGAQSSAGTVSSTLDFRSAAFSISAAAMPGSVVDRAKFKSVFACCVKYCLPIPMTHTINYWPLRGAGNILFRAKMWIMQPGWPPGACRSRTVAAHELAESPQRVIFF